MPWSTAPGLRLPPFGQHVDSFLVLEGVEIGIGEMEGAQEQDLGTFTNADDLGQAAHQFLAGAPVLLVLQDVYRVQLSLESGAGIPIWTAAPGEWRIDHQRAPGQAESNDRR